MLGAGAVARSLYTQLPRQFLPLVSRCTALGCDNLESLGASGSSRVTSHIHNTPTPLDGLALACFPAAIAVEE